MSRFSPKSIQEIAEAIAGTPAILDAFATAAAAAFGEEALLTEAEADALYAPIGEGGISMTSVQISSAELLALDVTPKVLLPALTGRFYYIIHAVFFHYRFGTVAYTAGPGLSLNVFYGSALGDVTAGPIWGLQSYGPVPVGEEQNWLTQGEDAYLSTITAGENAEHWNAWLASEIEPKAVSCAMIGGALTLGNGTVTARVFYSVIDGAP